MGQEEYDENIYYDTRVEYNHTELEEILSTQAVDIEDYNRGEGLYV